jgi:heme exporter protein D
MTLNLVFVTITVSINRYRQTLDQELEQKRRQEIIDTNHYKQSFYIRH